jgi:prolyl-tRNA editing enzyme YbaK/EbsC (Cys-tRNA(Pro) deacylase)
MHERAAAFADRARTEHGFDPEIHEFEAGTRTAAAAAESIGCGVAQIAASIVVSLSDEGDADGAAEDGTDEDATDADGPPPVAVVVTSGANRVDLDRVADLLGVGAASMADADTVKRVVGWSIGGVPPVCHATPVPVLVDETLLDFETVWAAAGTPEAVFPIKPERLVDLSGGRVAAVAED